jgi:hypothetical protein
MLFANFTASSQNFWGITLTGVFIMYTFKIILYGKNKYNSNKKKEDYSMPDISLLRLLFFINFSHCFLIQAYVAAALSIKMDTGNAENHAELK